MVSLRFLSLMLPVAALGLMPGAALAAESVPAILAERGITAESWRNLVSAGYPSATLKAGGPDCGHSDALTFADKAILAESVVRGRIAEVRYLYLQGGPFRTLYRIDIQETLKGAPAKSAWILSKFGPNRRDHRRWKHAAGKIVLQEGDQGVFFLDGRKLRESIPMAPAQARSMLEGKSEFLNEIQGVYLWKGAEPDADFIGNSGKADKRLSAAAMRATLAGIDAAMRDGGVK